MAETSDRVLMIVRDDSRFQDLMLEQEVFVMQAIIRAAGYSIDVVTVNDEPLTGEITLTPDLRVEEVVIGHYAGVMLPCMAPEPDPENTMPERIQLLIEGAKELGLPLGAMRGSVRELARAGALDGHRYSFPVDLNVPGAECAGRGVTVDGLVVTAASCPAVAKHGGGPDETTQLTEAFVEVLSSTKA